MYTDVGPQCHDGSVNATSRKVTIEQGLHACKQV